ncbi:Thymidylate kinase [compost metagenome]
MIEKVIPALELGKAVLCDRFVDSSLVYQGYARGLGVDEIYNLNLFATDGLLPDKTFWLDVDPEVGIARINANKDREINRLDLESINFHKKVQEGYQLLYKRFPERIIRIDANRALSEVIDQTLAVLCTLFHEEG